MNTIKFEKGPNTLYKEQKIVSHSVNISTQLVDYVTTEKL